MRQNQDFVILISANAEWRAVKSLFSQAKYSSSPYGEWFSYFYNDYNTLDKPVIFMHGGWGKVAAAGSTQYAVDRWHPRLVVNLGTCGGFEGSIRRGEVILVEKTIIYDIYEQMGDPEEHIRRYSTELDTTWLDGNLPMEVIRTILVSGDRDLYWKDVPQLKEKYEAIAGDWESGAIAYVAAKNNTPSFILRGVTDLVSETGGDAYEGKIDYYHQNASIIMKKLVESLPQWLIRYSAFQDANRQNKK